MELKPGYLCPPGYKQTEVGVIPKEWEIAKLGNLIEYTKGFAFKSIDYSSHGVRVVRVSDTSYDSILEECPVFVPESKASQYAKWRLRKDDLVISTVGSKPPMYDSMVGKVILIPQQHEGELLNQNAVLIRDKKRRTYFQQILLSHFRTKRYLTWIESIFRGNANQASITLNELFEFDIAFPAADSEQRAIAGALSDVDELIGALDQLIAKKRDLKQATMQQLLTGLTRLPGFSGEWEVKRLGDVADIDPDNLGSDTPSHYAFNYVSLEDVDVGSLRSYSEQVFGSAPSRARRRLREGDILVSTVRPNLQSHLLFTSAESDWVCSTGFSVVRCKSQDADPGYVFFHLFGHRVIKQIETLLTGSNYPAINGRDVRALEIPIPVLPEQSAIAAVLSDMDGELVALEQRRNKSRDLKQGMMQELLTGRTRLV